MKIRPALMVGDIVKLSKKGKSHPRSFASNTTMVVSDVQGDGVERVSVITCRLEINGKYESHRFYRSELWSTGRNAFI